MLRQGAVPKPECDRIIGSSDTHGIATICKKTTRAQASPAGEPTARLLRADPGPHLRPFFLPPWRLRTLSPRGNRRWMKR